MKTSRVILLILCFAIIIAAVIFFIIRLNKHEDEEPVIETDGLAAFQPDDTWVVYWDTAAAEELNYITAQQESVSLFACFYDDKDNLYIPEQFAELEAQVKEVYDGPCYLSVTNDIIHDDGTAEGKDTELLDRLLAGEEEMKNHAGEIIDLAKSRKCQGIELDYENVRDTDQWRQYADMIRIMWDAVKEEGIGLRVIMQSSSPVDQFELPAGPDYVVMCYNLYGNHSGPGPKADDEFLRDVADKFSDVPDIGFALSNGGFEWDSDDGVSRSLTTSEAQKLASDQKVQKKRDDKSGALEFRYKKEGSTEYNTVWYADTFTLAHWRDILEKAVGHTVKISLWRMEGI